MLDRWRRGAVVITAAAALAGLPAAPSAAAAAALAGGAPVPLPAQPRGLPAPVDQPAESEEAPGYFEQVSCSPVPMRGVRRLRDLALATYRAGSDGGVARSCVVGGDSEHKEGRAWDWMLNVHNDRERRVAGNFLSWLTRDDGVKARRLGVMYVIYNRRMWRAYDVESGWTAYSGSSPHTDHIHLSFTWAGARGRTSFWTGRVAGADYGPCAVFHGQLARLSARRNPEPCPATAPLVKKTFRPRVLLGGSRPAVRVAQRRLGLDASGVFDTRTWRAVKGYQRTHDLPVTGALDQPTWASLTPEAVRWAATEGYGPRAAGRYAAGNWAGVRLQRGSAGRPVAFLQKALRLPVALRNGLLGRRTAARVRAFKTRRGLADNAVVTPAVWEALATRP
jgi:peptidoglycan hydrolase-like protein with peptidoglycan-binding domain